MAWPIPSVRLRSPQTATVTVQIVAGYQRTRSFKDVPVSVRNLDNGLRARVLPGTIAVTLRGTKAAIGDLTGATVAADVDAAGRQAGDFEVEVERAQRSGRFSRERDATNAAAADHETVTGPGGSVKGEGA